MLIKYIKEKVIAGVNFFNTVLLGVCLLMIGCKTFADGVIPISSTDQTGSDSDFVSTMITMFQKDFIPLCEILCGLVIILGPVFLLTNMIKEFKERRDWEPVKMGLILIGIILVVGGGLLYLLDNIRNHNFTG